jgi:hypothetical protein
MLGLDLDVSVAAQTAGASGVRVGQLLAVVLAAHVGGHALLWYVMQLGFGCSLYLN